VTQYLVEAYTPKRDRKDLAAIVAQVRRQAARMRRDGIEVRYLRPIFVPEDETCFHLFEAASADVVSELHRRARLSYDRIVEAAS
jgi:hypothetical protein